MRAWLVMRVIVAGSVSIGGALLNLLPVLPPDWKGRGIAVSVVVLALYLWADTVREIRDRRQTPAYRDHVKQLQKFAQDARQSAMPAPRIIGAISLQAPVGRAFRQHFPGLGGQIDTWNDEVATDYTGSGNRLMAALDVEAQRAAGNYSGGAFRSLLHVLAIGSVKLETLTWRVQNDNIFVDGDGGWMIAPAPATVDETVQLLDRLWNSATQVATIPAVKDWLKRNQRSDDLWPPLNDALAVVEVTQDPPGRCNRCPA